MNRKGLVFQTMLAVVSTGLARAESDQRPKAEFIDAGRPQHVRCMNMRYADLCGKVFYACGEDGITYFKRDTETGKLEGLGGLGGKKSSAYAIKFAGGRLYAVTPHAGSRRMSWHGLAWYEIDPQTSKTIQKGLLEDCLPCELIIASPAEKDLYLKTVSGATNQLLWYHLAADGTPGKAGEVTGNGLGGSGHSEVPNLCRMSPDGKNIYCISADDHAIACIDRKASGEITFKSAVDLAVMAKRDPGNYHYQWATISISGDGKWVYATLWNGKLDENVCGIFKRDADTGALALQESVIGAKDKLANLRGWNLVSAPNGAGAFLGSWNAPLMTVKYDAKTGRLSEPEIVKGTEGFGTSTLLLDTDNGFLYGGGPVDMFLNQDNFFILKIDKNAK